MTVKELIDELFYIMCVKIYGGFIFYRKEVIR